MGNVVNRKKWDVFVGKVNVWINLVILLKIFEKILIWFELNVINLFLIIDIFKFGILDV